MKFIKNLTLILLLCALGAVGVIFWPKIRECCDRWLACQSGEGEPEDVAAGEGDSIVQVEDS